MSKVLQRGAAFGDTGSSRVCFKALGSGGVDDRLRLLRLLRLQASSVVAGLPGTGGLRSVLFSKSVLALCSDFGSIGAI